MAIQPVRPGSRLFVTGQTGSGKTRGMLYQANRQELPVIVIDTKIEPAFLDLPGAIAYDGLDIQALYQHYDEHPDCPPIILRPRAQEYDPEILDGFVNDLYVTCTGACIVIDELYPLHRNGQAGPGLVALLTRGRSRELTTIMGAQRPRRISLFCLSEADYTMCYQLRLIEDRARIAEATGFREMDRPVQKYWFWWADQDRCVLHKPVPLTLKSNVINNIAPTEGGLDKPQIRMV